MPGEHYLDFTTFLLELAMIGDDGVRASQGIYLPLTPSVIIQKNFRPFLSQHFKSFRMRDTLPANMALLSFW